jgi:hypothetical protein
MPKYTLPFIFSVKKTGPITSVLYAQHIFILEVHLSCSRYLLGRLEDDNPCKVLFPDHFTRVNLKLYIKNKNRTLLSVSPNLFSRSILTYSTNT